MIEKDVTFSMFLWSGPKKLELSVKRYIGLLKENIDGSIRRWTTVTNFSSQFGTEFVFEVYETIQ